MDRIRFKDPKEIMGYCVKCGRPIYIDDYYAGDIDNNEAICEWCEEDE